MTSKQAPWGQLSSIASAFDITLNMREQCIDGYLRLNMISAAPVNYLFLAVHSAICYYFYWPVNYCLPEIANHIR